MALKCISFICSSNKTNSIFHSFMNNKLFIVGSLVKTLSFVLTCFFLLFYLAPLWGTPLEAIANNALHFLFDRVTYWDRLGPLPPPPPPRKAKSKMSGSTMSLDSVLTVNTSNSKITTNSSYIFVDKKPVPTYRRRNSQVNIQLDPSKLNFNFKSVQSEREIRKMSRIPEDNELFTDSPSGFGDATPESAGQSITDYIKKELEHISEGLLVSCDI